MPTITNTLVDATGSPVVGAEVRVRLSGPSGWSDDGSTETLTEWVGETDAAGTWSVDLPSTSSYESDTTYRVREAHRALHIITVPDGPGPYQLREIITESVPTATTSGLSLDGLSDVTTVGALSGQALVYDGALWSPVSGGDGGGVTDHGLLTGLGDDDHPQYVTHVEADSVYVPLTDPRLSDDRNPTAHADTHSSGGSDPITPASIGASTTSDITTAVSGHEAAFDPHPGYLTQAEGDTAYSDSGHTHPGTTVTASPEGTPPSSPVAGDVWVVT